MIVPPSHRTRRSVPLPAVPCAPIRLGQVQFWFILGAMTIAAALVVLLAIVNG